LIVVLHPAVANIETQKEKLKYIEEKYTPPDNFSGSNLAYDANANAN